MAYSRARILADYVNSGDELALKAPLASPTFTGTVAIPNVANLETAVVANTAKVTNATHTGDVTGSTALTIADDAVTGGKLANDIAISTTGATALTNTLTVGVDDTGHDVIFYGATSGKKMQWDESQDTLALHNSIMENSESGSFRLHPDANTLTACTYAFKDDNNTGMIRTGADALALVTGGTERLKIDSSGNAGIGVTPRTDWHSTRTGLQIGPRSVIWGESGNNNTLLGHNVYETNSGYAGIADGNSNFFLMSNGELNYRTGTNSAGAGGTVTMTNRFAVSVAGHVAMATDSNLATEPSTARGLWLKGNLPSWGILGIQTQITTGTVKAIAFQDGDGDDCGELVVNAATNAVSLSTTSDYRLKENVIDMSGSITKLKSLKPKYFSYIKDPDKRVFGGFLAHEVSDIVPEAVHGEKDAMRMDEYEVTPAVDEVRDKDGNITTEAVPAVMGEREIISQQNMDQSKLVPLLVGALQEAIARIEALESA